MSSTKPPSVLSCSTSASGGGHTSAPGRSFASPSGDDGDESAPPTRPPPPPPGMQGHPSPCSPLSLSSNRPGSQRSETSATSSVSLTLGDQHGSQDRRRWEVYFGGPVVGWKDYGPLGTGEDTSPEFPKADTSVSGLYRPGSTSPSEFSDDKSQEDVPGDIGFMDYLTEDVLFPNFGSVAGSTSSLPSNTPPAAGDPRSLITAGWLEPGEPNSGRREAPISGGAAWVRDPWLNGGLRSQEVQGNREETPTPRSPAGAGSPRDAFPSHHSGSAERPGTQGDTTPLSPISSTSSSKRSRFWGRIGQSLREVASRSSVNDLRSVFSSSQSPLGSSARWGNPEDKKRSHTG